MIECVSVTNKPYIHPLFFSTDKEGHVKDYYTLESVLFLLKHSEIKHSSYAQQAASVSSYNFGLTYI